MLTYYQNMIKYLSDLITLTFNLGTVFPYNPKIEQHHEGGILSDYRNNSGTAPLWWFISPAHACANPR